MDQKIKKFFDKLQPEKRTLALEIRNIVLHAGKKITEEIKWGNLTFVYKGNLAAIYTYDTVNYRISAFSKLPGLLIQRICLTERAKECIMLR